MKLRLELIQRNGGTQSRAELDGSAIDAYGEAMQRGDVFPPIIVFYDGEKYWVADGFHRIEGASLIGWTEIDADIRQGTRRDAILFSVGANAHHGVRRTLADKRRAVQTLLDDAEWCAWSDREIARAANVSHTFVSGIRRPKPKASGTVLSGVATLPAASASPVRAPRPLVPTTPPASTRTPSALRDEKVAALTHVESCMESLHEAIIAAQRVRGPQDESLVFMLEEHAKWIGRACRRGAA